MWRVSCYACYHSTQASNWLLQFPPAALGKPLAGPFGIWAQPIQSNALFPPRKPFKVFVKHPTGQSSRQRLTGHQLHL
ncbi:uncharacterized protein METZ01_LOCUS132359 [marine metagenome]|uniref:Uncharacterized protein n=1 Tax=marine metagenome TaxID=408172 RepID=A0A381YR68_9ZZZZ